MTQTILVSSRPTTPKTGCHDNVALVKKIINDGLVNLLVLIVNLFIEEAQL